MRWFLFVKGGGLSIYKEVNPFYKSTKWRRKRENILRKYNYLCQESRQYGKTVKADTIHHIYPIEEYPELALVDWNLIPVSRSAHNTFHGRDDNKIVGRGLYWQNKIRNQFENYFQ